LGARWDGGLPLAGTIAAVLVCSGAHDDATRKRVERYLSRRFGIALAA
jgi:hypothetical protein